MLKMITTPQIRMLYALARESGMDNEALHGMIKRQTGCESLKEVTCDQARFAIDFMKYRLGYESPNIPDMATEAQKAYIRSLAQAVGFAEDWRLRSFLEKRFGVSHVQWISRDKAQGVITALKHMQKRGYQVGVAK